MKFYRDVLWLALYQIPSTHIDRFENMAAFGRDIFLPYMTIVQTSKVFFSESIQGISIKLYSDVVLGHSVSDSFDMLLGQKHCH